LKQIEDKNKYLPYTKKDFRKYWCYPDSGFPTFQPFEIIRPFTKEEKVDWTKDEDYDEEVYLVKSFDERGKEDEYCASDRDILLKNEIDSETWRICLVNLLDQMEYCEDDLMNFIEECKIEQYIKRHLYD
jgi:hypothetical protein